MMDLERNKAIAAFLPTGARRTPLAGDASFRRYERIFIGDKTFVLMDAPPDKESVKPFVAIAGFLKARGFSAPEILAADVTRGLLLLEDLGDDTFNRVLARDPSDEKVLYRTAVEVLIELHRTAPPERLPFKEGAPYSLPVYDHDAFYRELYLFPDWYAAALTGRAEKGWHDALKAIWQPLFDRVTPDNKVLTLRDYHADNLMWLPSRKGVARVGILDFQDGVLGHPAYDLVSLLQDARRPFDKAREADMIGLYLRASHIKDREKFLTAYQILGAQRNAKIIGIFTRLWKRDHKPAYPKMISHVWTLLEENLTHPALMEAKAWFDEVVPARLRGKPLPGIS